MGVYIGGMEMPKWCNQCACNSNQYCQVLGRDVAEFLMTNRFPDDCPLIFVPPHGKLVDVDVLAKQIEHERFHHTHTDGLAARHHIAEYGHFLKKIADAPTIIPADESDMDSFIHIFEEDDEEDEMDSFIRIFKD